MAGDVHSQTHQLKLRQDTAANINSTANKNSAILSEPIYATDTNQLHIFDNTQHVRVPTADLNDHIALANDNFWFGADAGASVYGTLLRMVGDASVGSGYLGITFENNGVDVTDGDLTGDPTQLSLDTADAWGFGAYSLVGVINDVSNAAATFTLVDASYSSSFTFDPANNVVKIGDSGLGTGTDLLVSGTTYLEEITTPSAIASVGAIYPKADNNLYFQDGAGVEKTLHDSEDTITIDLSLETYDAEPARASVTNLHGGLLSLATAQPLDSVPTDLVVTKGIGKVMIVVNAGSDLAGDITVTGETIDRDTGASTPADTDTITVDAVTTDASDTDTNTNPRYSFTGAYITSKWFTGTVTLSTANLTLTDVDVYHVSFEQFNDSPAITLNTFDANIFTTNVAAEFDAYLYTLEVTGDKCDISRTASLNVGADGETAIANKYWRVRKGALAKAIDGSTDGIWADVFYSNSPAYIEDVNIKIWASKVISMTIV